MKSSLVSDNFFCLVAKATKYIPLTLLLDLHTKSTSAKFQLQCLAVVEKLLKASGEQDTDVGQKVITIAHPEHWFR